MFDVPAIRGEWAWLRGGELVTTDIAAISDVVLIRDAGP